MSRLFVVVYSVRVVNDTGEKLKSVSLCPDRCYTISRGEQFVLASGSILFMKLYNDAFEEKGRYQVLQKLGFGRKILRKAAAHELFTSYAAPFLIMTISSYFSVHSLEKMMNTSLRSVHLVSIAIILAFFGVCYWLSVSIYERNAGIRSLEVK